MTESGSPTGDVNATALAVAACRAVEATRADALVADPFAAAFVAAAHTSLDLPTRWPEPGEEVSPFQQPLLHASVYIGVRTRFIDDAMTDHADVGQIVILGAGLDTRAYRLRLPGDAAFFELDAADTLDFKQRVLDAEGARPLRRRTVVPADLAEPWAEQLRANGFDRAAPTLWVVEGLLPYLAADAQQDVLATLVSLSAPGSSAVVERAVPLPAGPDLDEKLRAFSLQTGLPMADLLARANPPDPVEILQAAGWQATSQTPDELAASYGRELAAPLLGTDAQPEAGSSSSASRGGIVVAHLP